MSDLTQNFVYRHLNLAEAVSLHRNYGLDMIRAVAILLVVFCHSMKILPKLPYDMLLHYWTGFLGVELFFVLSGYLIGGILLDLLLLAKDQGMPFSKTLKGFWIRRWFRTLPNYYLFLIVNLLVMFVDPSELFGYWKYLFFVQNFFSPISGIMGESWSLAIEEWFYLSFPITLLFFVWRFGCSRRTFLLASLFYIVLFTILRSITMESGFYTRWDTELRRIVIIRLDAIAYGAFIMVLMRIRPAAMYKFRSVLFIAGLFGLVVSLFILNQLLTSNMPSFMAGKGLTMEQLRFIRVPPFLNTIHFTLTNISAALLLPFTVYQTNKSGRSKIRYAIAGTSIISYSMYLLQAPVYCLLEKWTRQWQWYYSYVLYWIFCFLFSYLVYTLFERRMTALREKFSQKGYF